MSSSTYSYRYYGYHSYQRERRPRQLNPRMVLGTLAFLIVVGPSVFLWHQYQLRRLSVALLAYADHMESEQRWDDAATALYRYWKIKPEAEVLGRQLRLLERSGLRAEREQVGAPGAVERVRGRRLAPLAP